MQKPARSKGKIRTYCVRASALLAKLHHYQPRKSEFRHQTYASQSDRIQKPTMKTRVLFSIVLLLASTSALFAQSGRKSSTSSSSTTTTTTTSSVAGPKTTEKKATAAPKVQLL